MTEKKSEDNLSMTGERSLGGAGVEREWVEHFRKQTMLLRTLEDQMEDCRNQTVLDSVSGSSNVFPYVKHTIRIEGMDSVRFERLKRRYEKNRKEWEADLDTLNAFIETIDDPINQEIIEMYAVDNLTCRLIGEKLSYSESTVSKRIKQIFKN